MLRGLAGGGHRGLLGVGVEHHLLQQHVQLGVAPVRGRDLADEPHPLVALPRYARSTLRESLWH